MASAQPAQPRQPVAIVAGDEHIHHYRWPSFVRLYRANSNDVQKLRAAIASGLVTDVIVLRAWSRVATEGLRGEKRAAIRFWSQGLGQLQRAIGEFAPPPAPQRALEARQAEPLRPPQPAELLEPRPALVVVREPPATESLLPSEVNSEPIPKWTSAEVDAVQTAWEHCYASAEMFVANFNELTDGRTRTAAELWHCLPRVAKVRKLVVPSEFLESLRAMSFPRLLTAPQPAQPVAPRPAPPAAPQTAPRSPKPRAQESKRASIRDLVEYERLAAKLGKKTPEEALEAIAELMRTA